MKRKVLERSLRAAFVPVVCCIAIAGSDNRVSLEAEIEMAKEAAPEHVTADASFMVWEDGRYVLKLRGTNGFTCMVVRDVHGRYEPSAFNEAAMKAVLPVYEFERRALEKGSSWSDIHDAIREKVVEGEFPEVDPGALVYMMSPKNKYFMWGDGKLIDIAPHVMLYYPRLNESTLGFNGKDGLPMFYNEYPHLGVVHVLTDPESGHEM